MMAAQLPDKKDLSLLTIGQPRNVLLAEYGAPVSTETRNGHRVDVFSFKQGYTKASKTGRAVLHGAADIFTLGLCEIVGTPTETAFSGNRVAFEVTYNTSDIIQKVVIIQGRDKVNSPQE